MNENIYIFNMSCSFLDELIYLKGGIQEHEVLVAIVILL